MTVDHLIQESKTLFTPPICQVLPAQVFQDTCDAYDAIAAAVPPGSLALYSVNGADVLLECGVPNG